MADHAEDIRWMRSALVLGQRGLGRVWPNPSVGCIIVKGGIVLGRGVTAPGGRPHAEAAALSQAGSAAKGATAYVTLEPCGRPGRDESCTDKLIRAGVARVVFAATDPNPQVNGHGCERLQGAGIAVTHGLLTDAAAWQHEGFFRRILQGRPMLTLKLAASLDGRIATASGQSRWITSPPARHRVHRMRAEHDAILIGSGTALADDPMLDVRSHGPATAPVRIVLDSTLRLDPGSRLALSARAQPLWLIHGEGADPTRRQVLAGLGADLIECPAAATGRPDLAAAMRLLGDRGLTRILCEGGGTLAAALLAAGLVDRLVWFSAGLALGDGGKPAIGPLPALPLEQVPRFRLHHQQTIGADMISVWQVSAPPKA